MDVWIGLVSVRAQPGSKIRDERRGGFVNVLALAYDSVSYAQSVNQALGELGLEVEGIDESEPFALRVKSFNPNQELRVLAEEVRNTGQVKLGPFHTYPDDDLSI